MQNAHRIRPHYYRRPDFQQLGRLLKDFRLETELPQPSAAVKPPMPPPIIAIRIRSFRVQFISDPIFLPAFSYSFGPPFCSCRRVWMSFEVLCPVCLTERNTSTIICPPSQLRSVLIFR